MDGEIRRSLRSSPKGVWMLVWGDCRLVNMSLSEICSDGMKLRILLGICRMRIWIGSLWRRMLIMITESKVMDVISDPVERISRSDRGRIAMLRLYWPYRGTIKRPGWTS